MTKLPVLVDCSRLHAKLSVSNCAKRWTRAHDGDGNLRPESLASCSSCQEGEARATGTHGK